MIKNKLARNTSFWSKTRTTLPTVSTLNKKSFGSEKKLPSKGKNVKRNNNLVEDFSRKYNLIKENESIDSKTAGIVSGIVCQVKKYLSLQEKKLSSPDIGEHSVTDLNSFFPINKILVPGIFAGTITDDWKRFKFPGLLIRRHMLSVLAIMKQIESPNENFDRWTEGIEQENNVKRYKKLLVSEEIKTQNEKVEKVKANSKKNIISLRNREGSGKSTLLNYAVMYALQKNWLVIFLPRAERVAKVPFPVKKATDREGIYYQIEYSRQFFKSLIASQKHLLQSVSIKKEYSKKHKLDFSEKFKSDKFGNAEIDANAEKKQEFSEKEDEDGAKRAMQNKKKEVGTKMESLFSINGETCFADVKKNNGKLTLFDMAQHGADSNKCPNPGSLLYDFLDEVNLCTEVPVFVGIDNINTWRGTSMFCDREGKKLDCSQLSFIDAFSQYFGEDQPKNGLVLLANKGCFRSLNLPKVFDFQIPLTYSNEEMQNLMRHLKGLGVLQSRNTDDHQRTELLSGKSPKEVSKVVELY